MSQLIENGSGWKFRESVAVIFPKDVANKMEKSKLQNFMSVNLFFLHAAL